MRYHLLFALVFVVFLLEGTIVKWLMPEIWQGNVTVASHFVLILVLFIGLYASRHMALLYGFGFGLLHDVVYYGPMLGTYTFTTALVGYLVGLATMRKASGIVSCLFLIGLGLTAFELIVYGIYRVFRITQTHLEWIFLHQMLPSVLFNLLFALLIYVPVRKYLEQLAPVARTEEE